MGSVNTHENTMSKTTAAMLVVAALFGGLLVGKATTSQPFNTEEIRYCKESLRSARVEQKLREKLVEALVPLGVEVQ